MTPAARVAAAIEVLDATLAGTPAEKALTNWARRSRFAGSKDRAAVRDLVFSALRCRRSFADLGGSLSGRGLMIGKCRAEQIDPVDMFTGAGHAPPPLSPAEHALGAVSADPLVRLDCPDWLAPRLRSSLGADFEAVCESLRHRAPTYLRVNLRKATRASARESLAAENIRTEPHSLSESALKVLSNPRKVKDSSAYLSGIVELQDAASQHVSDHVEFFADARILDYCAGGGGKALAFAARNNGGIFAHDLNIDRMQDIPARAARAGVTIKRVRSADIAQYAPFDVVFCDVPCSGSGSWRRAPEAKWNFSAGRLGELQKTQQEILEKASSYVADPGVLAYATCSLLEEENRSQIETFLGRNGAFSLKKEIRLTPLDGGDGFYLALLKKG